MGKPISYLITGGFGLIGSQLTNKLDGNITIVSRSDKHKERIKKDNVSVVFKDIRELEKNDLGPIDVIYHCASTVDNYNVLTNPHLDIQINLEGTVRLLEICKTLEKKPKIIFPSTFFVYGHEFERTKIPVNEESKTDPLAIYPATKLCAESIIKLYSRLYGIPYLICRLTNVYGENEDDNNKKKGVLNFLIKQAVKGETLNIYNGGNFYRDYVYVDDVVDALMFLEKKSNNETFLIGYGKPVLFMDIINYIRDITKSKSSVQEIPPPEFHKAVGITNFIADISKIKNLGWSPKIGYQEGLRKIINKYNNL